MLIATIALAGIALFSCHRDEHHLPGSDGIVYLDIPDSAYSFYKVSQLSDKIFNEQATLGRVLFYDRSLSINNSVSCGSCHKQALAFADRVQFSAGFENRLTGRNTPAIQNLANRSILNNPAMTRGASGRLFWDGRETNLRNLVIRPISNHVEMGVADYSAMIDKLGELPYYKELFNDAYGTEEITVERISDALSVFMQAIRADTTRFDAFIRQKGDLTALELEGYFLFQSRYDCNHCHNVINDSYFQNSFMNIGLDNPYTDKGLGAITGIKAEEGVFRIPNLRNVAITAPYMHDGRFKTLDAVLEHYSHGIKNDVNLDPLLKDPVTNGPLRMNITAHDRQALIAFLGTLTDMNMITNPNFSDPFKIK